MNTKFIGLLVCGLGMGAIISTATAQQRAPTEKEKTVKKFKFNKAAPPKTTETETETESDDTDFGANIDLDYTPGGQVGELDGTDAVPNTGASSPGKGVPRPAPSGAKLKFSDKPKQPDLGKAIQTTIRYAFPYSGTDLKPRSYITTTKHQTGIQGYGFDIVMQEWRSSGFPEKTWTQLSKGVSQSSLNNIPSDEQALIYRQPIYAMADGQVAACWRNTEENPRPYSEFQGDSWSTDGKKVKADESNLRTCEQSPWLHDKLCSEQMPGGGNMLWIKQANDVFALYAHMKPGTIPASLCPHNGVFFPAPIFNPELPNFAPEIAVTNGAMIKKGQYLGKTGNSGSSSGPHLHIHMERKGQAIPITFEGGLYRNLNNKTYTDKDRADEKWTSFSDSALPVKSNVTTFIWPNRKVNSIFNRKNVEARHYQATFDHLKESGMWPGVVTCQHIPFVNTYTYDFINWVKKPKGAKWYGKHGLSTINLVLETNKAEANGYKVTSSFTCGNTLQSKRSVVIFTKQ